MKSLFYKIIYASNVNFILRNILKIFNYIFGFKFILHPSGIVKTILKNNKVVYFKTNQTAYVTVRIFWHGYKSFEYSLIFIDLIKKIKTFFDVGANIGYYTILGGSINKNLKIISFEPSDGACQYVKNNIILNNLSKNVILEKSALSDNNGYTEFHEVYNPKYPLTPNLSGEHNIGTKTLKSMKISNVKTITLDNYIFKEKITSLDLIKLDTEGSEHLIIKKGIKTIKKFKPIIICEILRKSKNNVFINDLLKKLNYNFYYHNNNKLIKINSLNEKLIHNSKDYFFVHPCKEILIKEYL